MLKIPYIISSIVYACALVCSVASLKIDKDDRKAMNQQEIKLCLYFNFFKYFCCVSQYFTNYFKVGELDYVL